MNNAKNKTPAIKSQKKQIKKQIKRQVKSDIKSGQLQSINYFRRTKDNKSLLSQLRVFHKITRDKYLAGLIHPDIAVKEGIPVKMYSDVPIPTATIGFHEQYSVTTSSVGTFLASWRPNFLTTQSGLLTPMNATGQLTINNSSSLTGSVAVAGNAFVGKTYYPDVSIQRSRLVSAMIKVSYNGSVLNQAGTMLACATFDPFVCAAGSSGNPINTYADGLVDRFGNFSLIQNGLWNQTVNVTSHAEGIECLYIPIDPADLIFEKSNSYFGQAISTAGTYSPDTQGAPINYVIAGRNLPASSTCVMIDLYYNYEVIADPSSAPILRPSTENTITKTDHESIMGHLADASKSGSLVRKVREGNSWGDILSKVVSLGVKYIPMVLSQL